MFKKKYGERVIGIVYQKKELVWVDVLTQGRGSARPTRPSTAPSKTSSRESTRSSSRSLKNDNKLIDNKDFIIYEKENDEEE